MPGNNMPRSYWDSCVFLAWINNEPERAGIVDSLLRSARAGEFEIVTSVISVTEVALAAEAKQSGRLSNAALTRIDRLWEPPSPVKLVEVSRLIAAGARDLIRHAAPDPLAQAARCDSPQYRTKGSLRRVPYIRFETAKVRRPDRCLR